MRIPSCIIRSVNRQQTITVTVFQKLIQIQFSLQAYYMTKKKREASCKLSSIRIFFFILQRNKEINLYFDFLGHFHYFLSFNYNGFFFLTIILFGILKECRVRNWSNIGSKSVQLKQNKFFF